MAAEDLALKPRRAGKRHASGGLWYEVRSILWLVLGVLAVHSFLAKPFYIPSESMLPGLRVGDRLVVTKFPYGFSYVSPTFHVLPFVHGRLFGRMPERGDVVIVVPPGHAGTDYIKRVIGLPGDTIMVREGVVFLNGKPVQRRALGDVSIPVDANTRCEDAIYWGRRYQDASGKAWCRLTLYRETLPNGRSYDVADLRQGTEGDTFGPIRIPEDRVFLMGDNRDNSADSRFPTENGGLGGPVPWENLGGRAEFITFSLDGSGSWWNPVSWWESLRPDRAGISLHPERGPVAE